VGRAGQVGGISRFLVGASSDIDRAVSPAVGGVELETAVWGGMEALDVGV